ncbi:MAG: ammonium transporter [Bacillota bacterium]|nr:ammonium transporter [Bacillota bacterium]
MKKKLPVLLSILFVLLMLPVTAFADGATKIDTGDSAFMFISTVLVFIMTPGLALFYGGMVRKKNVLGTMMHSFVIMGLVSIQWVIIGYTLAFGPDTGHGLLGNLSFLGFSGVAGDPSSYATTIPHVLFAFFQMMFAIITPALITGAFAERIKFPVFLVFILLWSTFIYDPLAHWVWGSGGWLAKLGALDFAGGTVVHISSGVSGLVAAIMIGKRRGHGKVAMTPHNIPFVLIGASLLWFGWFGFNGGSALAMNGLAMSAFATTNTAAAAALLSWVIIEWVHHGKPTLLGAATGAVVGLVAITPAAGFVGIMPSIIIGLLVSPLCYFGVSVVKAKLGYDDALDAFGCHGIGGIWGAIATGLFADPAINSYAQHKGLFLGGGFTQVLIQLLAVGVTIALAVVGTFVILKVISLFTKLRVSEKEEEEGLDISQHGEDAYPDFSGQESISL